MRWVSKDGRFVSWQTFQFRRSSEWEPERFSREVAERDALRAGYGQYEDDGVKRFVLNPDKDCAIVVTSHTLDNHTVDLSYPINEKENNTTIAQIEAVLAVPLGRVLACIRACTGMSDAEVDELGGKERSPGYGGEVSKS